MWRVGSRLSRPLVLRPLWPTNGATVKTDSHLKRPPLEGKGYHQAVMVCLSFFFSGEQLGKFLTCARVRIRGLKNVSTMRATVSSLNATK